MGVGIIERRRQVLSAVVIVFLVTSISITIIGIAPGWNLVWTVQDNDVLSYDVIGFNNYVSLNDTVITGVIMTLPTIPLVLTPLTFASSVIEINKTTVAF